jgi:hypothetical protein
MKNSLLAIAVAGAALLAAHLAVAQTSYNLNVMEPLTGSGAFLGQGQKAALESNNVWAVLDFPQKGNSGSKPN